MNKNDCFNLGYIARRVGNHGELGFVLDVDDTNRYKKLESVFIELNNSLVPFFIKKIQIKGNNATVSLEGIESIERAEELLKKSLYLPLSALPPLKGKKFYIHELAGYTAIDKTFGEIGIITEVLDFPHQTILQIRHGENDILIPAKEEFIISIHRDTKRIELDAPEGLIDIYISQKEVNESEKETDEGSDV
ncbi:MAG: 16S rRNA processing protein RimM [Bacteroidetes bacterium]|nr:16S rRNA processing protein RimM [Bacteroidota bacterium]